MAYNKKAHLRDNIEVIRTAFALDREGRQATDQEWEVLSKYSGFGGIKAVLNSAVSDSYRSRWTKTDLELFPLVQELHEVLRENSTSEREYGNYVASMKSSSRWKLEEILKTVESNEGLISRISKDIEAFKSRVEYDAQGNPLNPIRLDGVEGSGAKLIAGKLNEIALSARTHGTHEPIGPLYGFTLMVKTETTQKEGIDFAENRFFVRGEGAIAYNYNNGILASADPKLASLNFLNALQTQPQKLLEKYKADNHFCPVKI